jgi:hypothetical protein
MAKQKDKAANEPVQPTGTLDENNVDESGTVIGTDVAPLTETVNAKADPHPHQPETGHRYGEKHGGSFTATSDDGKKLTWTDPDAVPGTIGDSAEETMKALHSAGSAAVEAK